MDGEDIADCDDSNEFAKEIPDAPPKHVKRCYHFLVKFLKKHSVGGSAAPGWFCTARDRFVAHDSNPLAPVR